MEKGSLVICLLSVLFLISSVTFADEIFRIDMDANTSGLQTEIWAHPGQTFTSFLELVLETDNDWFSGYYLTIWYDINELSNPIPTAYPVYPLNKGVVAVLWPPPSYITFEGIYPCLS